MKRLGIALCAFLLAIGLSGCKESSKVEEKAVATYAKAVQKFSDMKSGNFDMKILVDADEMNTHFKVAMDGSFNAESKLQMAANMNAAVNGIGLDDIASIYTKDDKIYADIMGTEKEYIEMPKEVDKIHFDEETAKMKKDVEAFFSEFTMEEKDGKHIITGVVNEKGYESIKKGFDDEAKTNKNAKDLDMHFDKVNEATIISTVNADGYMEKLDVKFDINYYMKDVEHKDKQKSVHMVIEAMMNFRDLNTVKSITFPSFKDYKKSDGTTSSQDILKEIENGNEL